MEGPDKNSVEYYLADDEFVSWVCQPTAEGDNYWQNWLNQNPESREAFYQAKSMVKNIRSVEENFRPSIAINESWSEITSQASANQDKTKSFRNLWLLLFSIILLASILYSGYSYLTQPIQKNNKGLDLWQLVENNNAIFKRITLTDGSTVILEPYSSLKYPIAFSNKQREVILKGEAFFDIVHDSISPFIIYANETITKVLGTSFTIKAFENNDQVEVIVKTGRVAVYMQTQVESNAFRKKMVINADEKLLIPMPNKKVEISSNQKVVINKIEDKAVTKIVSRPAIIKSPKKLKKVKFRDAPVEELFESMSYIYGIKLNYDSETLKDCRITTSLTDLDLLQKIEIVCEALNLKHSEKNGQIFIQGKGCKN